jgi:GT2 family glycosyltransferase
MLKKKITSASKLIKSYFHRELFFNSIDLHSGELYLLKDEQKIFIDKSYRDTEQLHIIEGWSTFSSLEINSGKLHTYKRADVDSEVGDHTAFTIELMYTSDEDITLKLKNNSSAPTFVSLVKLDSLHNPDKTKMLRSLWTTGKAITANFTDGLKYLIYNDLTSKSKLFNHFSNLNEITALQNEIPLLSSDSFVSQPQDDNTIPKVFIILPVYNNPSIVKECIERVLKHTNKGSYTLFIIDDASLDSEIWPLITSIANNNIDIEILRNSINLGFIGSVNIGFNLALERNMNVVLLNSDAMVSSGWLPRLLLPIIEDSSIATTTPFSSDATIFTIPFANEIFQLSPGDVDIIDNVAKTIKPERRYAEAPTGVGFCMSVNIQFLKTIGLFDISFGKGYGEEVDWCQRAILSGGKNISIQNLFVEHRGGKSFGSDTKKALIEKNSKIISKRYKDFDSSVQRFIRKDPLKSSRFIISMAYYATLKKVEIIISHRFGGGAEIYLKDHIEKTKSSDTCAIVIRVNIGAGWLIESHYNGNIACMRVAKVELLLKLLQPFNNAQIVYSNMVGTIDTQTEQNIIKQLYKKNSFYPLKLLIHDYYIISPIHTMLSEKGKYEGVPVANPHNSESQQISSEQNLSKWQRKWSQILNLTNVEIVVFSESSREIVSDAYPETLENITVIPHQLHTNVAKIKPCPKYKNIGILGNIGYEKGAKLISDISLAAKKQNIDLLITVLGTFDPKYKTIDNVVIHGGYDLADLSKLVIQYQIGAWFIPSICPETFSYATHEALATGMPVYALDIGAQAEAITNSGFYKNVISRKLTPLEIATKLASI